MMSLLEPAQNNRWSSARHSGSIPFKVGQAIALVHVQGRKVRAP